MTAPWTGRLAAYGLVIRGDVDTSEDQVAETYSPADARRLAACWNAFHGVPIEEIHAIACHSERLEREEKLRLTLQKVRDDYIQNMTNSLMPGGQK